MCEFHQSVKFRLNLSSTCGIRTIKYIVYTPADCIVDVFFFNCPFHFPQLSLESGLLRDAVDEVDSDHAQPALCRMPGDIWRVSGSVDEPAFF